MNVKNNNKLTGIPKIYYFSNNENNREIMENNFSKWNIENYERVLLSKDNPKNLKKLLIDKDLSLTSDQLLYNLIRVKSIIDWYDNETDDYCIFMEDNINIDLAKYWTFDWKLLIELLPYNWDCIQLNVTRSDSIEMYLKPKDSEVIKSSCFMITREFAKKLKNLHYDNGKYRLHINSKDYSIPEYYYGNIDFFLFELGICYTFPVFNTWGNYLSEDEEKSSNHIERWWKNESKKFTVFEKFYYYKKNDSRMKVFLNDEEDYKNTFSKKTLGIKMVSDGQLILWI